MKNLIKKILPESVLNFYHKTLAILASIYYGNPSKKNNCDWRDWH